MIDTIWLVAGAMFLLAGVGLFIWPRFRLAGTVLGALGVLGLVGGWLMVDGASRVDALRTAGLAAGAVVALYALWLNDRRRLVEEGRHELERQRAEHDRERVADERFGRAVEQLGSDADQVRVGAIYILTGIASARPAYTQTVLDVLCAYLRRPFVHPAYSQSHRPAALSHLADELFEPTVEWPPERIAEADRERQVRRTAEQQIAAILPEVSEADAPRYNLHLTGARLDRLDLTGKRLGWLGLQYTGLLRRTTMRNTECHGAVHFTGASAFAPVDLTGTVFHDRAGFANFTAWHDVIFDGVTWGGEVDLRGSRFRNLPEAPPGADTTGMSMIGD